MGRTVSDYVMDFVARTGVKDIFFISGGGNRFLAEAMANNPSLNYVCTHNEQALSMAVEGYARVRGFGVGLVTLGPGATNAITGTWGAYLDSTPCMMLSGQSPSRHLIGETGLRQFGVQEVGIIPAVQHFTKYASLVKNASEIGAELRRAYVKAHEGRPGPVWLDIPGDVQNARLPEGTPSPALPLLPYEQFVPSPTDVDRVVDLIRKAQRPLLYVGQGVRLAHAQSELETLLSHVSIPVVTSWNGADLLHETHPLYIGRPGMFGQRAANFAVQNSDLLLTLGARLSVPQVGYNYQTFAPDATRIFVDVDPAELTKKEVQPHYPLQADARAFLRALNSSLSETLAWPEWLAHSKQLKEKYPSVSPAWRNEGRYVNSYVFTEALSRHLRPREVVATDMGTSFTGTYQSLQLQPGQRVITSSGMSAMGWGLPGAIGACLANNRERTICLTGDGGLMFNLQELQTLKHHKLPLKVFIYSNEGYLAMRKMWDRNFQGKKYIGTEKGSGVSMPDFMKLAEGFDLPHSRIRNHTELYQQLPSILESEGPYVCELMMEPNQALEPCLVSRNGPDGKPLPPPDFGDMYPFLSPEELREAMPWRRT